MQPELNKIKDLMENGNWSDAIKLFKQLNCTPAEYTEYLNEIKYDSLNKDYPDYDINTIQDFALLGFYTKETIFEK